MAGQEKNLSANSMFDYLTSHFKATALKVTKTVKFPVLDWIPYIGAYLHFLKIVTCDVRGPTMVGPDAPIFFFESMDP